MPVNTTYKRLNGKPVLITTVPVHHCSAYHSLKGLLSQITARVEGGWYMIDHCSGYIVYPVLSRPVRFGIRHIRRFVRKIF